MNSIKVAIGDNERIVIVLPAASAGLFAELMAKAAVYERDGYYAHSGWKQAEKSVSIEFVDSVQFQALDPKIRETQKELEEATSARWAEYSKREAVEKERDQLKAALEALHSSIVCTRTEHVEESCEGGAPDCGPVEFHDSEGVPLCKRCWDGLTADAELPL